MLVYDISNKESFNKIPYWYDLLKKLNGKKVSGVLVG